MPTGTTAACNAPSERESEIPVPAAGGLPPGLLLPPCPEPAAPSIQLKGYDGPRDYRTMVSLAMALSRADLVPDRIARKPENLIAVFYIARALDLAIAVVWQNIYSTGPGSIGERSRLLHALARRAGHRLKLMECGPDRAVYRLWIAGDPNPVDTEYTILDAQNLGLLTDDPNSNWRRQPANMLRNRCLSRAVTWHIPETVMGMMVDDDGVVQAPPVEDLDDSGLSPEMGPLLSKIREIEESADPHDRYVRLRVLWDNNRLLLDAPADDNGTPLQDLLGPKIAAAKAASNAADPASGGLGNPADRPSDEPAEDPGGRSQDQAQDAGHPQTGRRRAKPGSKPGGKAGGRRAARKQPEPPDGPAPAGVAAAAATRGAVGVTMGCGCSTVDVLQRGHRDGCPEARR